MSKNLMITCQTDCREPVGITVGLIDALITICRILARRDLTGHEIEQALADLRADEDVSLVFGAAAKVEIEGQ